VSDCQDNCDNSPNGERVANDGCACSQQNLDDGDFCTTDICKDGLVSNQDMTFEQTTVLIQNSNLTELLYTASQTITTNQNVVIETNEDVRFYAGQSINLNTGFEVKAGAKFEAKITTECVDNNDNFSSQNQHWDSNSHSTISDHSFPSKLTLAVAPNPFNTQATIFFNLPKESMVSLQIFNLNGQLIEQILERTWFAEGKNTLIYTPKGSLTEGIYYVILSTNEEVQSIPIILME